MRSQYRVGVFPWVLVALAGCAPDDGSDGHSSLFRVEAEPAGAQCAEGGQRIDTGLDTDDDGALGDDEVAQTIYVCNGQGLSSLIESVTLAIGSAECEWGGVLLQSGLDVDRDALLDAEEVQHETPLCASSPCLAQRYSLDGRVACPVDGSAYVTGLVTNGRSLTVSAIGDAYMLDSGGGGGESKLVRVDGAGNIDAAYWMTAEATSGNTIVDIQVLGSRIYVVAYDMMGATFVGYLTEDASYVPVYYATYATVGGYPTNVAVLDEDDVFIVYSNGSGGAYITRVVDATNAEAQTEFAGGVSDVYADPMSQRLYIATGAAVRYVALPVVTAPGPVLDYLTVPQGGVTSIVVDDRGRLIGNCIENIIFPIGVSACPTGGLWMSAAAGSRTSITDTTYAPISIAFEPSERVLYLRGTTGPGSFGPSIERLRLID